MVGSERLGWSDGDGVAVVFPFVIGSPIPSIHVLSFSLHSHVAWPSLNPWPMGPRSVSVPLLKCSSMLESIARNSTSSNLSLILEDKSRFWEGWTVGNRECFLIPCCGYELRAFLVEFGPDGSAERVLWAKKWSRLWTDSKNGRSCDPEPGSLYPDTVSDWFALLWAGSQTCFNTRVKVLLGKKSQSEWKKQSKGYNNSLVFITNTTTTTTLLWGN